MPRCRWSRARSSSCRSRMRADVPSYKGRQLKLSFSDGGKSWDKTTYWTTASTVSVKDGKVSSTVPSGREVSMVAVYYRASRGWGSYYASFRSGEAGCVPRCRWSRARSSSCRSRMAASRGTRRRTGRRLRRCRLMAAKRRRPFRDVLPDGRA